MVPGVRGSAALWVLVGVVACGTTGKDDTKERIARFEAKLSKELGTEVRLECPAMIDQHYHYCTAVLVEDEEVVFPVRVKSRGNELDYATKRWVTGDTMVSMGKHALTEKLDIPVEKMECPRISYMPDGAKVRCDAHAKGVDIGVEVSMEMKVRKLHFEPVAGIILGVDTERAAHEMLGEKGVYTEVKCERTVWVSVPGKRFTCEAKMPDGDATTIHFLVTSKDGKFELGRTPPPGDGSDTEPSPAPSATATGTAG